MVSRSRSSEENCPDLRWRRRRRPQEETLANTYNKQAKKQQDLIMVRNLIDKKLKPPRNFAAMHTKRLRRTRASSGKLIALLVVVSCCFTLNHLLCNCQQTSSSEPVHLFPAVTSSQSPLLGAEMEPRSDLMKSQQQANALSELVNFLSNYANQQQTNNRLPRPPMGASNSNNRQPMMNGQQAAAGNGFASNAPTGNPLNRQRQQLQFPQKPPMGSAPVLGFPSSSPATPVNYLTLNRLAGLAGPNQQQQQFAQSGLLGQPPNNRPHQFNNQAAAANSNLQPVQANQRASVPIGVPPRGLLPQRGAGSNGLPGGIQMRPLANVPLPAMANSQPPRQQTSGGFAPSGPPPSMAAGSLPVVVPAPASMNASASEEPKTSTATEASSVASESSTNSQLPGEQPTAQTPSEPKSRAKAAEQPTELPIQDSNWNPVLELNKTSSPAPSASRNRLNATGLAPSPDIVTVPPGYNPDNPPQAPQSYDINVSAQMGGSIKPQEVLLATPSGIVESAPGGQSSASGGLPEPSVSVAPTAVTTIIWSPPADEPATSVPVQLAPSRLEGEPVGVASSSLLPVAPVTSENKTSSPRESSLMNDEPSAGSQQVEAGSPGVVYGKSSGESGKPSAPSRLNLQPAPVLAQATIESSQAAQGRPFIQSVQLDNQVRPFAGEPPSKNATGSAGMAKPPAFRASRPLTGSNQMAAGMSIGSGFSVAKGANNQTMPAGDIQDFLGPQPPRSLAESPAGIQADGEPTISAQGGPDPFHPETKTSNSSAGSSTPIPVKIRRPTFKPKPAVPPIRIDSCIVGDDSSCEQSHNERCVTEYGISSCHCKPGFARLSQLRGYCSPISLYQLSMRIERLSDDRKLAFNHTLENQNSEEFQYMEFETVQALASLFQQTSLARQFMGTKVNKFFERKGKVWANVSVSFELNNLTRSDKIQSLAAQELQRAISGAAGRRGSLGDSTILLDGSKPGESVSRLSDVNECASKELNDCSKFATCTNEFGSYQCQCLAGYEDKFHNWQPQSAERLPEEKAKLTGRVCLGCSASFCSNRGECSIVEGRKTCKCRSNFIGAKCDIDSEVLTVAVGGSVVGVVILVITFWCLYVFNRRWKREQQKMDAMSATSGLTFNYVNSSNNSLMSPSSKLMGAPALAARSMASGPAHHQPLPVANYNQQLQKFGAALVGRQQGYAPDQQAIMGSTSSSSSAASHSAGALYQYAPDEGLLIAPQSSSSEQTSPSNSNGGAGNYSRPFNAMLIPGNAYTLSGHHLGQQQQHFLAHEHHNHHHHHHHHHQRNKSMAQFNPAAGGGQGIEYANSRTMAACQAGSGHYDSRWRTLQQQEAKQQQHLVGYYLSPDMLLNSQQQQLYASPQRELCIDTGLSNGQNNKSTRRNQQNGRAANQQQVAGSNQRSRFHRNSSSIYIDPEYEMDRRI